MTVAVLFQSWRSHTTSAVVSYAPCLPAYTSNPLRQHIMQNLRSSDRMYLFNVLPFQTKRSADQIRHIPPDQLFRVRLIGLDQIVKKSPHGFHTRPKKGTMERDVDASQWYCGQATGEGGSRVDGQGFENCFDMSGHSLFNILALDAGSQIVTDELEGMQSVEVSGADVLSIAGVEVDDLHETFGTNL